MLYAQILGNTDIHKISSLSRNIKYISRRYIRARLKALLDDSIVLTPNKEKGTLDAKLEGHYGGIILPLAAKVPQ